jgi:DCN1-like protein 1/2
MLVNWACLHFLQLVLSWHMKAGTMCEFSKKEFIEGLQSLGYESYNNFEMKFVSVMTESLLKVL